MKSKRRLYIATGPFGIGKTTWALTATPPSEVKRVYWQDPEGSMNNLIDQLEQNGLEIGRYVDCRMRFGDRLPKGTDLLESIERGDLPWHDARKGAALIEFYEFIMQDITENLTPGKYSTYVMDPGEKLEAGMAAWCAANPSKIGVSEKAGFGKFWSQGVYPLYENLFAAIWDRGVDTIILTFHLKTPWENGHPVVNKVVMSGKKILKPLAQLMIWLVNEPSNSNGAPAGLVLKERMGTLTIDGDLWEPRRMLPRRLPVCTWTEINRYLREGCDLANPAPGELPSESELEMISPLLSDKQMELMLLDAKKELAETTSIMGGSEMPSTEQSGPVADPEIVKTIVSMRTDRDDEEIRAELIKTYPLPAVVAAFMSLGG